MPSHLFTDVFRRSNLLIFWSPDPDLWEVFFIVVFTDPKQMEG